jgi:hypothetical protein
VTDYKSINWENLVGGYRTPYSPVEAFGILEKDISNETAWDELWGNLHHQGDVDIASYISVPWIVYIYLDQDEYDWNTYALVAAIENCRGEGNNPDVPEANKKDYFEAISSLSNRALIEISMCKEDWQFASLVSIIALNMGFPGWGHILSTYNQNEVLDFINGEV